MKQRTDLQNLIYLFPRLKRTNLYQNQGKIETLLFWGWTQIFVRVGEFVDERKEVRVWVKRDRIKDRETKRERDRPMTRGSVEIAG